MGGEGNMGRSLFFSRGTGFMGTGLEGGVIEDADVGRIVSGD
jgi:hypothetical protein